MKTINTVTHIRSTSNLEYQFLKGMTKTQTNWVKEEIKKFDEDKIPWGLIRKIALETK
jgi:chitodextrinase